MNPDLLKQLPPDLFPGVIYIYDLENKGNYYMNSKFEELLGYSNEEIAEMGVSLIATLIHPEDKERVENVMQELGKVETGKTIKTEYRLKDKSGKWRWFADSACVSKVDEFGNIKEIVGTALEITDSKEASLHVDEVYNIFQLVLDNMPIAVSWKDLDGRYLGFNKQFLKKAGLPEDSDIVGKTDNDLPWKKGKGKVYREAEMRVMHEGKAERNIIEEEVGQDGKPQILSSSRVPVKDEEGDVVGILSTQEDVTDNVLMPKAIETLEKRYQFMLQTASDAVIILDGSNGKMVELNQRAEELTGYSRDELLGSDHELIHPEDKRADYMGIFAENINTNTDIREDLLVFTKKEETIPVEVNTCLFEFEGQKFLRCNYRDVSDARSVEHALQDLCNNYRIIIEESPQFILQINQELAIVQANAVFREFLGAERQKEDEIIFTDLLSEGDHEAFKEKVSALDQAGKVFSCDLVLSNEGGELESYSCAALAVSVGSGMPLEFQLVFGLKDTARKEEELRQQLLALDSQREEDRKKFENEKALEKKNYQAEAEKLNKQIKEQLADKDSTTEKFKEAQQGLQERLSELEKSVEEKNISLEKLENELNASRLEERNLKESEAGLIAKLNELETDFDEQDQMLSALREERRRAAQELKVQQAEYELDEYLRDVPIACIVIAADGKIKEWNKQAVRTFGYTHDEAVGEDLVRLIIPRKDRPRIKALYEDLRNQTNIEPVTRQCYSKDKDVINCEWHHDISPSDGSIIAFAYEVVPVADLSGGSAGLANSLRTMFGNNDSIILLVDGESLEVVDMNRTAEKFYGYTRRSLLRKRITEIDLAAEQEMVKLFEGQDELSSNFFTSRHKLKNDEIRDVEFYSSIFEDDGKKLIALIGHDVTERQELERKLQRSEELSRLALLSTGAGAWDWDLQTDTVTFSRSWKEMLGYADDEIGYNADEFYDRVHPDDLEGVKEALKEHLRNGEKFENEIRLRCRDGAYKYVRNCGRSVKDNEDNIVRFIGTNLDISGIKRLEEKVEEVKTEAAEAAMAKSHFIANMTREIRTPISAVVGFCELLRETVLNSVQDDYVRHINSSSDMLVRILDNMLDLVRIEVGTLEIKYEDVNPEELVSRVVDSFTDAAENKGLYLDFDVDENIPKSIVSDPARIMQILNCLLDNAVRFTNDGSIHVNLGAEEGEEEEQALLRIDVKDSGVGIPNKLQSDIFNAFSGVTVSESDQQEHYGFSLALSRNLARMLGGNISVESTVNKGSKFTVTLNAGISDSPQFSSGEAGENPLRKPKVQRPLQVLYIEDIELNQHVAEAIMEKLNHDLEMVSSAKEGLDRMREKDFDVILMDIHMPEMDGLECARIIRKDFPPDKQPYIIAVTAAVITNDRKSCLAAGMDDYLTKPLKRDTLKDALKRAYQKVVLDVK